MLYKAPACGCMSPCFTDSASPIRRIHAEIRLTLEVQDKHENRLQMDNETPCCNLIHLSISFAFFRDFLLPRIECTRIAFRLRSGSRPLSARRVFRNALRLLAALSASHHGRFMTASALPIAPSHSRRIVQLDGLRAIGVLAVFAQHALKAPLWMGVDLFFV